MVCFSFLQNICFQLRIIKQWYKLLILLLSSCNTSEHYLFPSHVTRGHQLKGVLEFAVLRFLPFFRWKKFHIAVLWGQQILTYTLVSIYWLRNIRCVPEQSRPYCIRPRRSTRPVIRLYPQHMPFNVFSCVGVKKTCYGIGELSIFREVMRLTLLRYSKTQMFSSVRAKRKTGLSIRAL